MEIELMDNLKIETDIPIKHVERFWFSWKPYCHAALHLEGYMDRDAPWNPGQSYNTRIKICLLEDGNVKIIYHGYIVQTEIKNTGKTSQIFLDAKSASCLLDRKIKSCSFQNIGKTYGEVVRETVQADSGQVIRNQKSDKGIGCPVIRYEETAWQFANRMAIRIGNYIIPDIETGNPNLWFGMRNGNEVEALPETQCVIQMRCIGDDVGSSYKVEGRTFYKIGDRMKYLGQNVTIVEVEGRFEHGELTFTYILEDRTVHQPNCTEEHHPAGQGFWGVIKSVKDESVKIALDIDHGEETGDYFYPWYPETGNSLYAMPEVGERVLLYFGRAGELEGAVIHCLNLNSEEKRCYEDRAFYIKGGNTVDLTTKAICFSKGGDHTLSLDDGSISANTSSGLKITAEGKVRLKAKQIMIKTPEELNLCQG